MKNKSLFTLILVLVLSCSIFISYADEASKETIPQTEISEGIDAQDQSDVNSDSTDDDKKPKKSYGVVSEYEKNLTLMNQAAATPANASTSVEQGTNKAKKLNAVKSFIKSKNNKLSDATVTKVAEAALAANEKNQLELSLILAVMWKESTFNPSISNSVCYGLMQIHKNTGAGFGYKIKDLYDPYKSADLGAKILKGHIKNYNSALMGLTAYNQGTGNVNRGNYNTRYATNVLQNQKVVDAYLQKAMA